MTVSVAIEHRKHYRYDRYVIVNPQRVRLRPAPHVRQEITNYQLRISPASHTLHWHQDMSGNHVARAFFPDRTDHLRIEVDLAVNLTEFNPFDFLLDHHAVAVPFDYSPAERIELQPFLQPSPEIGQLQEVVTEVFGPVVTPPGIPTIEFLIAVSEWLKTNITYQNRYEPGIQSCAQTLARRTGCCRDTAWLLAQILRSRGVAARFVSGYLIQLRPDDEREAQRSGILADGVDYHAWTESYLPGAGWIGMDPTSGMFAGAGHLPLATAAIPESAAAVSGRVEPCAAEMQVELTIRRTDVVESTEKPPAELIS